MLARFLATVAALLLACASPQAQAHVRAPERVSASFADLARAAPPETALPAKSASKPKTAPPARATLENPAPGENAALSHWHVCKNWSPLPNCTVGIADDVWGVEKASTGQQSRLGHTGYLKDPLLADELYAQARQYRAGTGRFTSRDEWAGDNLNPITLNKFLYGNGNPGSYTDPSGNCAGPALVWCVAEGVAWLLGIGVAAEVVSNGEPNNTPLDSRDVLKYGKLPTPASSSGDNFVTEGPRPATILTTPAQPAADGWFTDLTPPKLPDELVSGLMPGRPAEVVEPTTLPTPIPEENGGLIYTFPSGGRMDSPIMLSEEQDGSVASNKHAEQTHATPKRGADGRYITTPRMEGRKDRKTEYPSDYRRGVWEKVVESNTIQSGPNAGMVLTIDGEVVHPNDPRLTIEHLNPVVEHWNSVGFDTDRETRRAFYNDVENMALRIDKENSRDGGRLSAQGVRYRQDVGDNYKPD